MDRRLRQSAMSSMYIRYTCEWKHVLYSFLSNFAYLLLVEYSWYELHNHIHLQKRP